MGRGQASSPADAGDTTAQLREAHERIKLLAQEAEVMRRAIGYLSQDANPKTM
ncbi:hypothetical protein FIV07_06480 [Mycobacterium sp. THAF192]|nr:hypothetical protein FIV07_06480 [Mycobacterium sp. THAF192]